LNDTSHRSVRTTCPYCGVGCGVEARTDGRRLIGVRGDPRHPANAGRLCVKGAALAETQGEDGRLRHPQIGGRRVSWDTALDHVAAGFAETIARHGPGAVAFYLSGQLLTEDYYVANKLMKGFIGSANVDTNSRLCMASAVAAHQRAFGEDVVPCQYEDLDACDLVVLVGSNAAWTHPVLYQRIVARKARGGLKVVVIDPRRTATCDVADLHLAIRPGMDAALFNGLLVDLAERGAVDRRFVDAHTEGFRDALALARADADGIEARTGLDRVDLATFFGWFATTRRVVTFFSQGVNQASNGTDKANSIINVHLATGRIGRAGMGPFSITGQPNAMGGREVGGMANQLAAHQDFSPGSIDRIARFWGAPRVAGRPGLKAVDMFDAVGNGGIGAIWIMGTNPAVSLPRAADVGRALEACPLVVVSDCVVDTETTRLADVLLPACGWGEKDGTVTNSERCISRQRAFLPAVGEARPDWWIVCQVAARLGFGDEFDYASPAEIFREHAALTAFEPRADRVLDLGHLARLSDTEYDDLEPVRWGPHRPFADGRFSTASGKARFVPIRPHEPTQRARRQTPLVLNTGRLRDQWHTMTRTGLAPRLLAHASVPQIVMHPQDATGASLAAGDLVEAFNGGGLIRGILEISDTVPFGSLFYPIHWNGTYATPCRVSDLIETVVDPISGQPEGKHGVVGVTPVAVGCWLRCVSRLPRREAPSLFAVSLPSEAGTRRELALDGRMRDPVELVAALEECPTVANLIRMTSPEECRWIVEVNGAVLMAGALAASRSNLPDWPTLERLLDSNATCTWRALGAVDVAPSSGRMVCTCFEVSERRIRDAISNGSHDTAELGRILGCGTNCGSCLPELNALVAERAVRPTEPERVARRRSV